jgi:mRNA interferase MazF
MVKTNTPASKYIPQKGDLVWMDFDPTLGHEQKGVRPAIVVSDKVFNMKSGLVYVCPITSTSKNYPYRIKLKAGQVKGFIMTEHLKSVDWNTRNIKFVEKAPFEVSESVKNCIGAIID